MVALACAMPLPCFKAIKLSLTQLEAGLSGACEDVSSSAIQDKISNCISCQDHDLNLHCLRTLCGKVAATSGSITKLATKLDHEPDMHHLHIVGQAAVSSESSASDRSLLNKQMAIPKAAPLTLVVTFIP